MSTTTVARPRARSSIATASASARGAVGGGPSTASRTRPCRAATSSVTSMTSSSGVTAVIATYCCTLDDGRRPLLLGVGVLTGPAAGLAAAQQVPGAVELDAQRVEAGAFVVGEPSPDVGAFEMVLLVDQFGDAVAQVLVHVPSLHQSTAGPPRGR